MKHTFYYLLVLFSLTYLTSCSTDSIEELDLLKDVPENVDGTKDKPEKDPEEKPKDEPDTKPVNTPNEPPKKDPLASCDDFDWTNIVDNKITIDCIVDLNGQTIDIPNNTTVVHEGGDVKNGTLNFAGNGEIDGELLSSTLNLNGNVQLTKDEFEFIPSRWEIVEGKINDEVARANRDNFENTMYKIKDLGGKKFIVNELDAYFKVDAPSGKPVPSLASINVPSDYHLLMSDKTHLRMQPNAYKQPRLMAVHRVSNVIIEGGFLHGDRDEHDYSNTGTHEWGHTLTILGSTDITIKNVVSMDATGDGITVSSYGHAFDPHYRPCDNILITGCKIIRSRRNGIGSGDGRNVVVENNEFIDVGQDTNKSTGTPPRMAIDIEAHNRDGKIFQIAKDFTIRNNKERGSVVMSFYIASGFNIIIENNVTESPISYFDTHNSIIRNNTIIAATDRQRNNTIGIWAGSDVSEIENFNNKIYGNTIKGYAVGIDIVNYDNEVYDNTIIDCRSGIVINSLRDSKVYNNTITSTRDRSFGIGSKPQTKYINNVIIEKNKIDVAFQAYSFIEVNLNEAYSNTFEISNNTAKAKKTSDFNKLNGLNFNNNTLSGGMRLVGAENSIFSNNKITTIGEIHGIDFSNLNKNITVKDNNITVSKGRAQCIRDKENNTNISHNNNTCNSI